jgi:hypothetical protein
MAVIPQLVVNIMHHTAGDGEANAFVAAALGQDEGIDPDQFAIDINERPTAVAGINGRIGLDINHRAVGIGLARDGADDSHGHGVTQTLRASEREDHLSLPQVRVSAKGKRRQAGRFNFD